MLVVEGEVGCMEKGLSSIVAEGGVEGEKTRFVMAGRHWFAIGPMSEWKQDWLEEKVSREACEPGLWEVRGGKEANGKGAWGRGTAE